MSYQKNKKYLLSKVAVAVTCMCSSITHFNISADEQIRNNEEIERVEITGSRIKRTDLEGVINVTTITSDDMIKNGFNNVYDALSNLTAAGGAVLGEINTGSYTPGAKELNLRGLGPEYTLILVNGKRLAYYPMPFGGQTNFVNLDMIPTAMVQRIDIQTGGASAIYGSEAMGGVINIVTKKGIEGHYVELQGGTDTYGTNNSKALSFVGGFSDNDWSVDYAAEYKTNDGLVSGDRPYHDSDWDNPSSDARIELNRSITVRSDDTLTVNNYAKEYCNTSENPHSMAVQHYVDRGTTTIGASCGWDENVSNQMINKNESASVYVNGNYQLTDEINLFANAFYIQQQKQGTRGSLFYMGDKFWDPDLPNKDGGYGGAVKQMWRKVMDSEYTDDGYGRTFDDSSYSLNFGLEGEIADYDYSIGFSRSVYDFNDQYLHATNTGFASILGPQLGTHNDLPVYRPDYKTWYGGLNKEKAFEIADWVVYEGKSYNNTFTADITGDLFDLPAGPVAFSAYIELMDEGSKAVPDERVLNKEFSGLTGVITDGSRNRYAAAAEFLIPVLDNLDVEAAVRYDYYDDKSDVGGAASSQVGFTYRPAENLVIRSAFGTTFRGPDMAALYKGFSGNFGSGNDRTIADACLTLANESAVAGYDTQALTQTCVDADITADPTKPSIQVDFESVSKGDLSLKEETGTTFTTGLVYELNEYFSFNVDYYNIVIKDKIQLLGAGYIMQLDYECQTGVHDENSAMCSNMASRIQRYDETGVGIDRLGNTITGEAYVPHTITEGYINAAERRDSGVDLGFKGLAATQYGDFDYKFNLTRTLGKKEKLRAEDELVDLISDQNNFDFRTMANASVTWQKDGTAVSLLASYKGKLWNNANYSERKKLPAWIRYNLTLGQQITDESRVVLTITNLFNAMPPQDETFSSYPFYRMGAYDTLGRQFNLRYTYSF
ncbi:MULTISPECIES: TonB-dependent receptor domain-containing protein [unclassified Pseudoalteromonas]|uniref:TonB-dependent receptor domain-containing protein n=1 Tax=unclassified Pseudoalteromonas TaxID=194690 RepID=UPI0009E49E45|nr:MULTISPECIES: TonB-dependent receptor [unclassified Pseudoalteromonas]